MDDDTDRTNAADQRTELLGTQRGAEGGQEACLVVIRGARLGARIVPGRDAVVIGRDVDADFQIAERSVSRRHCRIVFDEGRHWVEDLGSTNRTFVNDEPVDRAPLRDGDHLRICETTLKFVGEGNIEAEYHSELHEHSIRDALTGLFNRRHAMAVLATETARAQRNANHRLSVALLDIDFFKPINDEHGHLAGDRVLRQLGERILARIRGGDTAARIGGEEFLVVMPDSGPDDALELAESLRRAVEERPFDLGASDQRITISGGVAVWQPGMDGTSDLLRAADHRLYAAKESGRNRIR
ncbi:GGDEF domain-containing protein [Wenzhouxiangella sp. XN79A]|uniref:GGDEF domain-containing protein n=1 Tax=Wenzhouxiangella sp. XN79A TaxID=2724193 RepID=UPI00144ABC7E|nr:GGDEF domain-containing protein [Wenzhouxiangella sp. XN79A]NKI35635.1 GGDEF domain-containing protein [Wenzhouxiangella sp. XN79A]